MFNHSEKLSRAEKLRAKRLLSEPPRIPEHGYYGTHEHDPVIKNDLEDAEYLAYEIESIFNPDTEDPSLIERYKALPAWQRVAIGLGGTALGLVGLSLIPPALNAAEKGLIDFGIAASGGQVTNGSPSTTPSCVANNGNWVELPVSLPTSSLPTTQQVEDATVRWVDGAETCTPDSYVELLAGNNPGLSVITGPSGQPNRAQVSSLPEIKSQVIMWLPVGGVHSS